MEATAHSSKTTNIVAIPRVMLKWLIRNMPMPVSVGLGALSNNVPSSVELKLSLLVSMANKTTALLRLVVTLPVSCPVWTLPLIKDQSQDVCNRGAWSHSDNECSNMSSLCRWLLFGVRYFAPCRAFFLLPSFGVRLLQQRASEPIYSNLDHLRSHRASGLVTIASTYHVCPSGSTYSNLSTTLLKARLELMHTLLLHCEVP